jgi:hypothetical protein
MEYRTPSLALVARVDEVVLGIDPNGSDNLVTFQTLPASSFGSLGMD